MKARALASRSRSNEFRRRSRSFIHRRYWDRFGSGRGCGRAARRCGARVRPGGTPLQLTAVQIESPAGKAGLRAGDLILQVNGRDPRGFIDFNRELMEIKDQHAFSLLIQRGPERRTLTLRLVAENTFFNADLVRKKTGATVQELTPELARGMGIGRVEGVLIAGVDKGSPAAAADLARGMLITSVDGQNTADVVSTAKKLYARGKGEKVRMEVILPRQRGPFVEYRPGTAEVTLR